MDYRQQLTNLASNIHNVFGLQEQGRQLVILVTKAVSCRWACLLFLEVDGNDFATLSCSRSVDDLTPVLKLRQENPVVEYLSREKKLLSGDDLDKLIKSRRVDRNQVIRLDETELIFPVIGRDRLLGILMLSKKNSGNYKPEDLGLLEDVITQVAVSMEKQYLLEELTQRTEKLSLINRCVAIISSTMDIRAIFHGFVAELKKMLDINWAAIVLLQDKEFYFLALSSDINSIWQVGERLSSQSTAIERLVKHKRAVVEPDLSTGKQFVMTGDYIKQGIRSIVYLPLMVDGKTIGSLILASRQANAYSQSEVSFLEQLTSQIAMPIVNARLYAEIEEKARIDELTGLFNRRSLDEAIANEINRHLRYGGVFSLIILDLDRFKAFNDSYGHLAGDKLLTETGNAIRCSIRGADRAFRYGGDEFAILLPNTTVSAAMVVAERVRTQIASRAPDDHVKVTASLGLASWPANGKGPTEVVAAADAALYHAKRNGGNQSHCTN